MNFNTLRTINLSILDFKPCFSYNNETIVQPINLSILDFKLTYTPYSWQFSTL